MTGQTALLLPIINDPTFTTLLRASKNPIPEDPAELVLANIVECDFPGYEPCALNDFGETENDALPDYIGEVLSENKQFRAADNLVEPQAIHFLYITRKQGADAASLLTVQDLPEPYMMDWPGKTADFRVRVMASDIVP